MKSSACSGDDDEVQLLPEINKVVVGRFTLWQESFRGGKRRPALPLALRE